MGYTDLDLTGESLTWLSFSIFCSPQNRGIVLNKGILPFLFELNCDENLIQYFLAFNISRGDHIRFAIEVNAEQTEATGHKADIYFKRFFFEINLSEKKYTFPAEIDEMFMPFPENSIQYGLYQPFNKIIANNGLFKLNLLVSKIIISVFKDFEYIEDDHIMTLYIYLSIALFKAANDVKMQGTKSISLLESWDLGLNSKDRADVISGFENQKEGCLDILKQVYSPDLNQTTLWLKKWGEACNGELSTVSFVEGMYKDILENLKTQLCINDVQQALILYFISKINGEY